MNKKA